MKAFIPHLLLPVVPVALNLSAKLNAAHALLGTTAALTVLALLAPTPLPLLPLLPPRHLLLPLPIP